MINKLSKDLFFSTTFSILNVLFNIWLIKNAEFLLSSITLGVFLLMRRVVASFTNLSQLGASQAIIRFVSLNKSDKIKHKTYFFISFLGWFFSIIILFLIYNLFGSSLGEYTYTNNENSKVYFFYTLWYIAILHLSYIVQPFFLTQRKIITYNIINTLNATVILLLIFIFFNNNTNLIHILHYSFILMSILQLFLMIYIIFQLKIYNIPTKKSIIKNGKQFYLYGIPRSMITFSDMFLLTIGALLVSNGEKEIAPFLLTLVLARMVLVVLQPVSKLSSVIIGNDNGEEKQKQVINIMTGSILYFTVFFLIVMLNWLNVVINYWLSNNNTIQGVIYAFNIIAIGLIPYALFNGLKGIIEIKFFKPYNLFSLLTAIVVHIILFLVLKEYYSILVSLSISLMFAFVTLGSLTMLWCRRDLYNVKYFRLDILTIISIALFSFNYYMKTTYHNIYGLLVSVSLTTIIFMITLYYTNIKFVKDTLKVLLKKQE